MELGEFPFRANRIFKSLNTYTQIDISFIRIFKVEKSSCVFTYDQFCTTPRATVLEFFLDTT